MVNRIKPVDPVICISRQGLETTITKMLMGLQKKRDVMVRIQDI